MAKWGKCDFSQMKALQKNMKELSSADMEKFCTDAAKELAARLLAKVIKRTPVGDYPMESGKKGGTLRRGWTGQKNQAAANYAKSLSVTKSGDRYTIEIINPVEYASYVEYGHRTRNGQGWVKGRFMLTISEQELEAQAPAILEAKLKKYLGEAFDV